MLKEALIEMLKEKNIYHIAIRDLCERADVNRSTFYKHYGSQFDLLDDMENDLLRRIEKSIAEDKSKSGSTVEKILSFLESEIEFVRLLLNSNVDPDFPKKLFSLAIIERSIGDKMGNTPRVEYEYINRFVLYGAYEMIRYWLNKEKRESAKEFARIVLERMYLNIRDTTV